MRNYLLLLPLLFCYLPGPNVRAQVDAGKWTEVSIDLPISNDRLAHRKTTEIASSPWSVGGETMDRDYTIYGNWKDYVEDLGIKKVRLQSGWAKTEKTKGEYDFSWLDEIVYDLKRKGIDPWISISYGNQLYWGGVGQRLGAKIPSSGEAYVGWKNYVRALVTRYADIVDTWEVWNEPNNHWHDEEGGNSGTNGPADYGRFFITTGQIIREVQPDATIIGFALAGMPLQWAGGTLAYLAKSDGMQYLDLLSYHPYSRNPDDVFRGVQSLQDSLDKYAPGGRIKLYQGENGAPSEFRNTKALSNYDWTELSQAKWFLRRALADYGRGINTSLFSIVDLKYPDEINRKGLLLINDNKEVVRPKHAYYAVRNMVNVLDGKSTPILNYPAKNDTYHSLSVYGFETEGRAQAAAIWFDDSTPSDYNAVSTIKLHLARGGFTDPVYVELRTGVIYDLPEDRFRKEEDGITFYRLPVYDSPILITERGMLHLAKD